MRMDWTARVQGSLYGLMALLLTASALPGQSTRGNTLPTNVLMPQPALLQPQTGAFPLTANLAVTTTLQDPRLLAAVDRFKDRLQQRTGIHLAPTPNAPSTQPGGFCDSRWLPSSRCGPARGWRPRTLPIPSIVG